MPVFGTAVNVGPFRTSLCSPASTPEIKSQDRTPTQHLDHVVNFQLDLSARNKNIGPISSSCSVPTLGRTKNIIDWGGGSQADSSLEVSFSTALNDSASCNSSLWEEQEPWSSRFTRTPSLDTLFDPAGISQLPVPSSDSSKKNTYLPALFSDHLSLDAPETLSFDKILARTSQMGASGCATKDVTQANLPTCDECSLDNKDDDNSKDVEVQELMASYDIISSLEADAVPNALGTKNLTSALKKLRQMPTRARRMLVLKRHRRSSQVDAAELRD